MEHKMLIVATHGLTVRRLLGGVLTLLLAACDSGGSTETSQVAARVNDEEISVHQVNFLLQRQPPPPAEAATAGRRVLERLIDEELAVQRAKALKLERQPDVLMALESARRDVLARAYSERIAKGLAAPESQQISSFYSEHPELFKNRKVYQLQELLIEAPADQVETLRTALLASKSISGMTDFLRTKSIRFTGSQAVRAAEQLPIPELASIAALAAGEPLIRESPTGLQVVVVAGTRSEPVDEASASPFIERYLLNEQRRRILDQERRSLRQSATIEYMGAYRDDSSNVANGVEARAAVPASGASSPPDDTILKGLRGLK